ncbi:unnamed protein product [Soboliphyme baturini]|uniref:Glutathione synthetase n=1 Tax=Soboliphyme baturini TaxID=241478 RepID=A0A183IM03_9BILA|nr:unnamed protein product [Soboliphyme baturini]
MNSFDYLPFFNEELVPKLLEDVLDWALIHGLSFRRKGSPCKYSLTAAPFTLLPSKFPADVFFDMLSLQPDMGSLYRRIAYDFDFVKSALQGVGTVDKFVENLLNIYKTVEKEGITQPLSLDVQRSDYMCSLNQETHKASAKQIEVNNIAVSFAGLASVCSQLHKWLLRLLMCGNTGVVETNLPANDSLQTVAAALVEAWKLYGQQQAAILFVVEEVTLNVSDQRLIEYAVSDLTGGKVRVLRLTLGDCYRRLKLDESRGRALVLTDDDNCEIAVAYFRTGYVPEQYDGDNSWAARMLIERSRAIKCPWIGYQLAGTKKIQQLLTNADILRRFVSDDRMASKIQSTFANMYGLEAESADIQTVIDMVLYNPGAFVMKPQLEGGGNNLFDEDIVNVLKTASPESLQRFIIMDRVFPLEHRNIIVRSETGEIVPRRVVSELGIFGCMIGDDKNILWQLNKGHLLRTKLFETNEGGVIVGASALDSPYLS